MKYLVSKFPCSIVGEKKFEIQADVKYELQDIEDNYYIIFGKDDELPVSVNFKSLFEDKEIEHIVKIDYKSDKYVILYPKKIFAPSVNILKIQGKDVVLSISNELTISYDSEMLLNAEVGKIKYSHFETRDDYTVIYFDGNRKYVVILKGKEICCADYYDEINISDNELYLMTRQYDSLNHGKVYSIKDKKFDKYLIYLDEEDMNMKSNFSTSVFLDALLAENYNYCNQLLSSDIRPNDASEIKAFFPEFDDFFPLDDCTVALIKKYTLVGIFEFELSENIIQNIVNIS